MIVVPLHFVAVHESIFWRSISTLRCGGDVSWLEEVWSRPASGVGNMPALIMIQPAEIG